MGGYRQWNLPKELINFINNPIQQILINQILLDSLPNAHLYKDLISSQVNRYKIILQQWTQALSEKINTIILMDDNIDTSLNAKHNKKYKITELYDLRLSHINNHNITQHNNDNTRYVSHQPPSCIDHIYSNCPNNISNIATNRNIFSDHCTVTGQYHSKEILYQPKFFYEKRLSTINQI